jgi:20S proteasome alpha/beta subunit
MSSNGLITIESSGSMSLATDGTNYLLEPNNGPAVELSFGGAPVVAGQFDGWTPIAAAQTASGYEVAWKMAGADEYTVWYTDANGNYLSSAFASASGSSIQLELLEPSFNDDLNGDGTIGVPASDLTVIESSGSMSLATDGTNYLLEPNNRPSVELSYDGAPVTAGQFAGFMPIAAAQTANGYEVAWKMAGADEYTVWYTDANGNYLSSAFDSASGSSTQLESLEPSFNDDLNGDGVIGVPPPTVIESSGSMSLATDGTNYLLEPNGGTAVDLSYDGAPVTAGQFGGWTPIAAAQTASGYEVAWKMAGADEYTVWYTDANGNYLSSAFASASGSSIQLELLEPSFNDDLNGDGTIGVLPSSLSTIESSGSMSLLTDGTNYLLDPNSGPSVELSYDGAPVTAGQFGGWTPIAAGQTASGYEVAWKMAGADQYTVWYTDPNGNYLSSAFASASGSSTQLESLEPSFNDDLNDDGVIGVPPPTEIESSGSMSLLAFGDNYLLQPNGGTAVELSYDGAPVTAGQFGGWTPIAAAQTASGYEVAWKMAGADQYTVWYTDGSGNYLSSAFASASGSSIQLESLEASFNDDLNGDGVIGVPPPAPPQFVYEGTDAYGAQLYDVEWNASGLQPFAVRVLTPTDPSSYYQHTFLYDLPVEAGLSQSTYGDGLDELEQLNVQNQYNATIIEPIFPIDPWYADSATDPTINYNTFMSTILPQWVDSTFDQSGTDKNLLIGFSKSGYGALDLLLKDPSVFDAAAAFDFPADITNYDQGGSSSTENYGTQANFEDNYELSNSFVDAQKAPFTTQDRILISEGETLGSEVADFDSLLTSQGVMHTTLNQTNDAHSWTSGWLPNAVAGLYGLEQNLHLGASV